jgi:FAD/FMN-containing dehydrogenase
VVTTSSKPTENPDLFWAIRGAGSNFGVVTEFVYKLYPQRPTVFSGILTYPLSSTASNAVLELKKLDGLLNETKKWWYRNQGIVNDNDIHLGNPNGTQCLFFCLQAKGDTSTDSEV